MLEKLSEDIKTAMKSRDQFRLDVLRMMKSKIMLVDTKGKISEAECFKILATYSKRLKESIDEFKKVERLDAVEKTENELKIVEEYLPKQMSDEEIKKLVLDAIQKTGAASKKEMGKVMKEALASNATLDGNKVKDIVLALLP